MHLRIRRARSADCAALLALVREHATFERSAATIVEPELARILAMRRPPVRIFIAANGDGLIAYAALTIAYALWRGRRWAHLDCLFVKADARGGGVGAALLHHVIGVSRDFGADRVEWQTPDWNERAIAFYRREGARGLNKMRFRLDVSAPHA